MVFGLNTDILNWDVMEDEIGIMSPAYMSYHVKDKVNYIYLKYFIKLQVHKFHDLIKLSTRVGQGLDKDALMNKVIYVPNEQNLNQFMDIFNDYNSEILLLNNNSEVLTNIRSSLLKKMLDGSIDVSITNI